MENSHGQESSYLQVCGWVFFSNRNVHSQKRCKLEIQIDTFRSAELTTGSRSIENKQTSCTVFRDRVDTMSVSGSTLVSTYCSRKQRKYCNYVGNTGTNFSTENVSFLENYDFILDISLQWH